MIAIVIVGGLSALIVIHELGHFLVAKFFGLFVEEFGIGMPPRIGGRRIGETLFSLNWLPLGGFVKVFGLGALEKEPDKRMVDGAPVPRERNFNFLPVWKRAV